MRSYLLIKRQYQCVETCLDRNSVWILRHIKLVLGALTWNLIVHVLSRAHSFVACSLERKLAPRSVVKLILYWKSRGLRRRWIFLLSKKGSRGTLVKEWTHLPYWTVESSVHVFLTGIRKCLLVYWIAKSHWAVTIIVSIWRWHTNVAWLTR
jgi:hypothetical protein